MKQNSVNAAVMTAPGKFEVRRYPYPEIDDVSMVIELEMCGICGTDKHTFRGETVQYAGTPAESHTPFPIIPGHEIVGKVAEIGKTPGRHVSRHSLRQVLVLQEYVRLSAVPEHQRLRQRLHL
jgi:D-arabinose 1-dehydrogenase-like Zn-dependent alcohol dehydrogenase